MKQYHSIPHKEHYKDHNSMFYVFDKLDGSNVRAEWTVKQGFCKFGRRRGLLDATNEILKEAEPLIRQKYEESVSAIFNKLSSPRITCFFEFYGPTSFAGGHADEPHTVTLFDVFLYKKGIIPPQEFIKLFGHLGIPRLLHHGIVDQDLIAQVEEGTLEGMTFEGVVCKGGYDRKKKRPMMFKIKNKKWLEKLRIKCAGDDKKFEMLR